MKFTENTLKRALRTFFQAAAAYICVNLTSFDFSVKDDALKTAVLTFTAACVAAGIAAVMNLEDDTEGLENE